MGTVTVTLKSCYGIKALNHRFDFSKRRVYAIYAPNGVMKSSFALTFRDAMKGIETKDRVFPDRASSRSIKDQTGTDIAADKILVVLSYDNEFGPTKKTSTLLVDESLRKEHEKLTGEIESARVAFLGEIREQSGSKRDLAEEIAEVFASADLETALTRIQKEIEKPQDTPFSEVNYDLLFDEKALAALGTKDLGKLIKEFIERYAELLAGSTYFKRGTFDYYNAAQIAKTLTDHGFFSAKHTLNLRAPDGQPLEIRTRKELEAVIAKEKDQILTDPKLRKSFDEVSGQLWKNVTLRDFQSYLMDNPALLSRMDNVPMFKQDVLKSYIKVRFPSYARLMKNYASAELGLKKIKIEADKQKTQWQDAIDTFNSRFLVPFKLSAKNKIDVILGNEELVSLGYIYEDQDGSAPIKHDDLVKVLSNGELKAHYILNVIFEIETRRKAKQETLIIIDDLADSFDYRNKYAIVEYLKEISADGLFQQVIMTHNFDFFRTIQSRFVVDYDYCLMAFKRADGSIVLEQAAGIKNVFAGWKQSFFTDDKKKIACIPFLRNLTEFTKGETDANFLRLTSLLHWKADTSQITVANLDTIFTSICGTASQSQNAAKLVYELIDEQADACLGAAIGVNFENKIVLAIAIRLRADKFMIGKISDAEFVASLTTNQTGALMAEYKRRFPSDLKSLAVLDRVILMTPENIHLNSFMYEPIIDMSDEHLKKLYVSVKTLA
jgi:hypothetical protein